MKRGVILNCHCNNYIIQVFFFGFMLGILNVFRNFNIDIWLYVYIFNYIDGKKKIYNEYFKVEILSKNLI